MRVWVEGKPLDLTPEDLEWRTDGTLAITLPADPIASIAGASGSKVPSRDRMGLPEAPVFVSIMLERAVPSAPLPLVSNEVALVALAPAALAELATLRADERDELTADLVGLVELDLCAADEASTALASRALRRLRERCASSLPCLTGSVDAIAAAYSKPLAPSVLLHPATLHFRNRALEDRWQSAQFARFSKNGALLLAAQFLVCFIASSYAPPALVRHPAASLATLLALVLGGLLGMRLASPALVQAVQTALQIFYVAFLLKPKIETYCLACTTHPLGAAAAALGLLGLNLPALPFTWLLPRVLASTVGASYANMTAAACAPNPLAFPLAYLALTSLPLMALRYRAERRERIAWLAKALRGASAAPAAKKII